MVKEMSKLERMKYGQQETGRNAAAGEDASETVGAIRSGHARERGDHRDALQAAIRLIDEEQQDPTGLLGETSGSPGQRIFCQLQEASGDHGRNDGIEHDVAQDSSQEIDPLTRRRTCDCRAHNITLLYCYSC